MSIAETTKLIRVFVHLARNFDARKWQESWAARRIPDFDDTELQSVFRTMHVARSQLRRETDSRFSSSFAEGAAGSRDTDSTQTPGIRSVIGKRSTGGGTGFGVDNPRKAPKVSLGNWDRNAAPPTGSRGKDRGASEP
jgi:hypothetical protein